MPVFNPLAIPTQEPWQTPTLLNGWTNYGTFLNAAGYWKDSFGVVHLRGVIRNGTSGSFIFVLPSGYRPPIRELLPSISTSSGGIFTLARVDILSTGEIQHMSGGTEYITLDGLTFRAA